MNRRILWILLIIAAVSATVYFTTDTHEPETEIIQKVHRFEPAFRSDGFLGFITPSLADTLSTVMIEIADTPADMNQGLMNRSHMNPGRGMLFIFDEEAEQIFWMKNTIFSLDIIFIDRKYKIVQIAEHTVPFSKEPIPGIYPAKYVLEVNAGYCKDHHISEGYHVFYSREKSKFVN